MVATLTQLRTVVGLLIWTLVLLPEFAQGEPPSVDAAPHGGGTFEAQWSVEGTQEELDFAGVNSFAIFQHTGTVTVQRSNGFVANALSKCIGLRDDREGIVSRCVWVSSSGDQIFSKVTRHVGGPNSRAGTGHGQIVGGTGRFRGISGAYELSWVNEWESRRDAIKGKTLSMKGNWRLPESPGTTKGS